MAEFDLSLVDTDELMDALSKRGQACVIGFVRKDGNMGVHVSRLTLIVAGHFDLALWATTNLFDKSITHAEDDGLDDPSIDEIVANIVYDPETDPQRKLNGDADEDES